MKKYKSYRKQAIECDKNGTRIEVECIVCGQINLICKKHNCYCHSKACFEERGGSPLKEWCGCGSLRRNEDLSKGFRYCSDCGKLIVPQEKPKPKIEKIDWQNKWGIKGLPKIIVDKLNEIIERLD